jgi:hypothetical protein
MAVFHLALLAILLVGALFDDAVARRLRTAGATLVLFGCLAALFCAPEELGDIPPEAVVFYPLVMAVLLAGYGRLLRHLPSLALAVVALLCWLSTVAVRGYLSLRQVVAGLDQMALSLVLFAVAVLISLGKSGFLSRWLARRGWVTGEGEPPTLSPSAGQPPPV